MGLVEQISWLTTLSILPMQLSCIRRKIEIVLGVVSPDHLIKRLPEGSQQDHPKSMSLNTKEGPEKKGSWAPQKPVVAHLASPDKAPKA